MKQYFEGWYFKHQNDRDTLCLIAGRADDGAFVQVITDNASYVARYPLAQYHKGEGVIVTIGENTFSTKGINVSLSDQGFALEGNIVYRGLVPLKYDIMGPFVFLPMPTKHSVVSMNHILEGSLCLNGDNISFRNGKGYIEGDRGNSFPESYAWVQCNDFPQDCSVMLSIAKIALGGLHFWGCICVVWFEEKEYRFATYKGVHILSRTKDCLAVAQGPYRLEVRVEHGGGHKLAAPQGGRMVRTIHENASTKAQFVFYHKDNKLFDYESKNASFEFVE